MTVNVEIKNSLATLILVGRLDSTSSPLLEEKINDLPSNITQLVLDMSSLDFISSAGLRVLLSAQKKYSKLGNMELISVREEILEVFELTGFIDILTIK